MKKRILSIALVMCMVLALLPVTALAATNYDGWEAATAEGVTLTENTDTVTIDGVAYTYKGDASTSGIEMYTGDESWDATALTETCCWKAKDGYVLYQPTVENGKTTSAEVTLHDAEISAQSATALYLPLTGSMEDGPFPVPVTVYVEGANSLATSDVAKYALYNGGTGSTIITGGGTLSLTSSASSGFYSNIGASAVTINSGTQVTVSGGSENTIEELTITGSNSKLTIVSGTKLNVISTCTVDSDSVLENNGTLNMMYKTKDDSGITGKISGSGGIQFDSGETLYCLVDGVFYPYGGDVSASGLNLSGKNNDGTDNSAYNAPTEVTRYKAGNGYISYTPATADPAANAKLELHGATISTTSGRALYLPAEPVDITVTGDNSLTANGSYNYAIDTNEQAVNITGDGNLSLTGSNGIVPSSGSTPSITINIGGALNIKTTSNPIQNVSGNLQITAKSITIGDAYGVFCDGSASFEATDGDITLTGGSGMGAVNGNAGVSLKASGKITVDNSAGSSALISQSGTVTVDAQGDVAMEANGIAILFGTGVSITSNVGSIDVTTSGYSGIEKTDGGTGGGGVTLNAAKDIALNADTAAISTSAEDVCLTAGGKLSSTSKYGFQVGELTIKANEVSIEGTQQDGILATSVSITNPTGGNCKSVSVTGSGGDSYAAIRALGSADTGNITVKADDLFLCGKNSAKAISALGTVTIEGAGLIIGEISAGTENIAASIARASKNGGKISNKLDLKTNTPTETTYYEIDNGTYIIFTPKSGDENAVLTLHNVNNAGYLQGGSILPDEPVTLKLEGVNVFFEITASNNITVSGNGSLNSKINNSNADSTVTVGDGATLNAMYSATADGVNNITIYGTYYYCGVVGQTTKLKLNTGAVLKLAYSNYLEFQEGAPLDNLTIGAGASILNDTHITLPKDTTAEQIKALPLSGTGIVRVAKTYDSDGLAATWDTYTNDGVQVNEITGGLDLSTGGHSGATLESDGYQWDSDTNTLTLGNTYVADGLTLPCGTAVTINTTASSSISGTIRGASDAGGYAHAIALTFTGAAPLTINGGISGSVNGDTVTVQDGAQVTLNGSISIGASGTDGTLTVTGAGTVLDITSESAYGAICDTVNVQNGAALTVHTQGAGTMGVEALSGGVSVTGGSTLTVGCDYGVYIIGGALTLDSSSKLITNGAVAPFCIVGAANSTQNDVLSLAVDLPSGTEIAFMQGEDDGYGNIHTYWSLVPTGGSLSVSDESNTPVTLTGASTGTLTFVKAASTPTGGGGSGSTSYTLTFETNGGSAISSVSKTSGTVVDLSGYKPTRDGYTFAGWYSDAELTNKITSVTLTKNTTVYAKWTKKTANPFADVSDSNYYYDAVLWAVDTGVTSGTTATTFSPDGKCTRAQAVTFLWRTMGSPEPVTANCPFTDSVSGEYYYNAVLWAVENGITKGTSATTFSPNDTVTRCQAMTFLWRAAGKPEETSFNPFSDVTPDAYYYDAVLWAVEKGVTQGTSSVTFSPSAICTRAQIVAFLFRYADE